MRAAVAVSAGVAVGLAAAPVAEACSLAYQSPAKRVRSADAAIHGTVASVRYLPEEGDDLQLAGRPFEAKIRITRVYKGRMGPAVRVTGQTDGGSCGIGELKIGERIGLLLDRPGRPYAVGLSHRISLADLRRATRGRWHRPGPA